MIEYDRLVELVGKDIARKLNRLSDKRLRRVSEEKIN